MLASNANGGTQGDATNIIMGKLSETIPTGIHDVEKNNLFRIYPNPAKSSINLSLDQLKTGKYDVSITALDGKVLMETKNNASTGDMKIDISTLTKGIYMLTLHGENGTQTTRFVKQ